MTGLLPAALMLALAGAANGMSVSHEVRVDHRSGPVAASYRGDVAITHRQVGAVAAPGKSGSLRCEWSAKMIVARHAKAQSGAAATRIFETTPILGGRRAGWCDTHRTAIAREVAARAADLRGHLVAVAREDHDDLRAELDRIHGAQRTG